MCIFFSCCAVQSIRRIFLPLHHRPWDNLGLMGYWEARGSATYPGQVSRMPIGAT